METQCQSEEESFKMINVCGKYGFNPLKLIFESSLRKVIFLNSREKNFSWKNSPKRVETD